MAFEIDTGDFDPDDVGGQEQVMGGAYHAMVEDVNEDGDDKGNMVVDLQILRGTTPGQEGKHYQLKLKREFTKWAMRKLTAFAIATRLTTLDAIKKAKDGTGPKVNPEFANARGKSICIKLVRDDEDKWTNLDWDSIWTPEDKRASHIPLHKGTIDREGVKLPATRPIDGILARPAKDDGKKKDGPNAGGGAAADLSSVL